MAIDERPAGSLLRDRYRIETIIGQGGFGATYRAVDLERFDAPRAIKRLHPSQRYPERAYDLFEREARVLASLSHPLVPHLHHFFKESGEFYLVEDYIDGETWSQVTGRAGPVRENEAIDIALDVLDVLVYLHAREPVIIHRDIKPSNLMRRAVDGRTLLVDFGAVREMLAPGPLTTIGTPGFAPPEQILGEPVPSSDLYALGATLLQLLSGRPPQEWSSISLEPLDLANRVPCTPAFGTMVARLFAPIERRYQSAAEARRDLLDIRERNALVADRANAVTELDDASVSQRRGLHAPRAAASLPHTTAPRKRNEANRPLVLTVSALGVVGLSVAGIQLYDTNRVTPEGAPAATVVPAQRSDSAVLAVEREALWSVATRTTQAGPTLEFVHPSSWTVDTASSANGARFNYQSIRVQGDSDAIRAQLPDNRGVFMAAFNRFAGESITADAIVGELGRRMFGRFVSVGKPVDLANDVWQSKLQVGSSNVGLLHVVLLRDARGALVLSRTFLGNVENEQRAIEIIRDSLHVK